MPPLPLALPAQSNPGIEPHAGAGRLINCYAESTDGPEQKTQMIIRAASGLDDFADVPGVGGVRGILEIDGQLIVAAGRTVSQVDSGGGITNLGGFESDGYVGMARNARGTGPQVAIVCDGIAKIYADGALNDVTDTDLQSPVDVCHQHGYFIYLSSSGRLMASEINSGAVIDGLDIATAESSPDGGLRVVDRGQDIVVIGPRSTEFWQDTASDAFPFSRVHAIAVGAVSAQAVTKCSIVTRETVTDSVAWASTDRQGLYAGVIILEGNVPRKVSTSAVDRDIAAASKSNPTQIIATSWVEEGHAHVSFRLPTTTWVYDTSTQKWWERKSLDSLSNETTWRCAIASAVNGRMIVGSATDSVLYQMAAAYDDEAGTELVLTCQLPPLTAYPDRVQVNRLDIDAFPGVGLGTGDVQDVTPELALRRSRDGGETWSNEMRKSLGVQGQRLARQKFTQIGTSGVHGWTFQIRASAKVVKGLVAASWEGRKVRA